MSAFKNGTLLITSSEVSQAIDTDPSTSLIGEDPNGNNFEGKIGEILGYNRVLSNAEINEVLGDYLSPKWKIPVATI